ncbi:hypothetical protein M1403_01775 [Patescibacteria group bacterium]|nr:hypothetical protein [Patescibacteria group bacterium]
MLRTRECDACDNRDCKIILAKSSPEKAREVFRICRATVRANINTKRLNKISETVGLPEDLVRDVLSDGADQPNFNKAPTFIESMSRLDKLPDAEKYRKLLDPAWFNNGKFNKELADDMLTDPERFL